MEAQKAKKDRRTIATAPAGLNELLDSIKCGQKPNQEDIDKYNNEATRQWTKEECLDCENCKSPVARSLYASHCKLCTKDFPVRASTSRSLQDTRSTINISHSKDDERPIRSSLSNLSMSDYGTPAFPSLRGSETQDRELQSCKLCNRKFTADRVETHQKACQKYQKGQETHKGLMERAKRKKLDLDKFKEKQKKFVTHRWKQDHALILEMTEKVKSYRKDKKANQYPIHKTVYQLYYEEAQRCGSCHNFVTTRRLNAHEEVCKKSSKQSKQKSLPSSPPIGKKHHIPDIPLRKTISHPEKKTETIKFSATQKSPKASTQASKLTETKKDSRAGQVSPGSEQKTKAGRNEKMMESKPEFKQLPAKPQAESILAQPKIADQENVQKISDPKQVRHVTSPKQTEKHEPRTKTAYLKGSDFTEVKKGQTKTNARKIWAV